jgi:glutathione reductase (NADPH)
VGLQEKTARDQGLRFQMKHEKTSGWYSSRRVAEPCSGFKVLVEEGSGRILGAHLLGPGADELVNFFALAIRFGLRATDFKEAMFAYPTHASDIRYMV